MTLLSIGDLALGFQTRLGNQRIRSEIGALTGELTTGQTRDAAAAARGDLSGLAALERGLSLAEGYRTAAGEAALFTGAMQRALAAIRETGADLGPALLEAGTSGHSTMVSAAATDARARLETVIGALNTRTADRALFAGAATDSQALADRDAMLAALGAAVAGETTAAGVIAAVETWFDTPGGGFDTAGYQGAATDLAPFRVGPDRTAEVGLRADDPGLRDLLKGYALAALVAEGALSGAHDEQVAVMRDAALRVMAGDGTLAALGADVGRAEAAADAARAAMTAETTALEIARNEILGVDPYRTATALQNAQSQLETLYAVTARLSRLSLTEYLR
jgi:flagellar hook-associated protein 3 FlgL